VIDTINPGVRENLEVLNEFFTDPTWIKVRHVNHAPPLSSSRLIEFDIGMVHRSCMEPIQISFGYSEISDYTLSDYLILITLLTY